MVDATAIMICFCAAVGHLSGRPLLRVHCAIEAVGPSPGDFWESFSLRIKGAHEQLLGPFWREEVAGELSLLALQLFLQM